MDSIIEKCSERSCKNPPIHFSRQYKTRRPHGIFSRRTWTKHVNVREKNRIKNAWGIESWINFFLLMFIHRRQNSNRKELLRPIWTVSKFIKQRIFLDEKCLFWSADYVFVNRIFRVYISISVMHLAVFPAGIGCQRKRGGKRNKLFRVWLRR